MSDAFRLAVTPPSNEKVWEWCSKHVKIANSELGDKYQPEATPWVKAPLERLQDLTTRKIIFLAPTGSGKSTIVEALTPWIVSERPGPVLYASQTNVTSKRWSETRFQHSMKTCEKIKHLWPRDRHKVKNQEIIFPHMPIVISGANLSAFQEISMQYLIGDEVWEWDKGLLYEFYARHHNRRQRKILLISQAGNEGCDLDDEIKQTTLYRWGFVCDSCGSAQPMKNKNIKPSSEDKNETCYKCPECGHEHADDIKTRLRLANSAGYLLDREINQSEVTYKLESCAVWRIPWSTYFKQRENALKLMRNGDPAALRAITMKRDTNFWKEDMAINRPPAKIIKKHISKIDVSKPLKGETIRFMTIDRGDDHFWWLVRAWSKSNWSMPLGCGFILADGRQEKEIKSVQERYGVSGKQVMLDVGFEMEASLQICLDHEWLGVRGDGRSISYKVGKSERIYSPIKTKQAEGGGIAPYIFLATNPAKDILHRQMLGLGLDWKFPKGMPKAYWDAMKSEVRREPAANAKNQTGVWETIKKRKNHLWDCEVYQIGLASIAGMFGNQGDD